jgi:hypothetical protein
VETIVMRSIVTNVRVQVDIVNVVMDGHVYRRSTSAIDGITARMRVMRRAVRGCAYVVPLIHNPM